MLQRLRLLPPGNVQDSFFLEALARKPKILHLCLGKRTGFFVFAFGNVQGVLFLQDRLENLESCTHALWECTGFLVLKAVSGKPAILQICL